MTPKIDAIDVSFSYEDLDERLNVVVRFLVFALFSFKPISCFTLDEGIDHTNFLSAGASLLRLIGMKGFEIIKVQELQSSKSFQCVSYVRNISGTKLLPFLFHEKFYSLFCFSLLYLYFSGFGGQNKEF
jgi:hypothetical protein